MTISIGTPAATEIEKIGGGFLEWGDLPNVIRDGSQYEIISSDSADIGDELHVIVPHKYGLLGVIVITSGDDLIESSSGTDTSIEINGAVRFTLRKVAKNTMELR